MPRVYAIIGAILLAAVAITDVIARAASVARPPENAASLTGRTPALAELISLNTIAADWAMIALAAVLAGYGLNLHGRFWRYYLFRLRQDAPLISRQHVDGDPNMSPASPITMADLAQRAGVDFATIQLSVRHGLIGAPQWDPRGHGLYHPEDAGRLTFVRRMRELGFSWEAVCELAVIRDGKTGSQQDVYDIVERHLSDIRNRLTELTDAEAALATLASRCPRQGPLSDCPILNALSQAA